MSLNLTSIVLPSNLTAIFFFCKMPILIQTGIVLHMTSSHIDHRIELKNLWPHWKWREEKGARYFVAFAVFCFCRIFSKVLRVYLIRCSIGLKRSSGAAITRGLLEGADHCCSAQTHVTGVDQPFPGEHGGTNDEAYPNRHTDWGSGLVARLGTWSKSHWMILNTPPNSQALFCPTISFTSIFWPRSQQCWKQTNWITLNRTGRSNLYFYHILHGIWC